MNGNKFEAAKNQRETRISMEEKNDAQLRLMEAMGATDTPTRTEWIAENSSAFRELWGDQEFKELIKEGNFGEAVVRLKAFKEEQREAA